MKLTLNKETLLALNPDQALRVAGGTTYDEVTCNYTDGCATGALCHPVTPPESSYCTIECGSGMPPCTGTVTGRSARPCLPTG